MILQALYRLAEKEGLLTDPDFEPQRVAYLVRISRKGELVGLQSTYSSPQVEEEKKKKLLPVAKYFSMPRERPRTSGARAFFLFDKAEYAFGRDPDGKRPAKDLTKRFDLFRQRVKECLEATDDEGIRALNLFLDGLGEGQHEFILPEGCKANDLFTFIFDPDIDRLMIDRPPVREYWHNLRREEFAKGETKQCLVTGKNEPVAELFPTIKQVPGGTTSGVSLVSFNASAFESHGWSQNENAPISLVAADAIGDTLKRLIYSSYPNPANAETSLPLRNMRLGMDTVVCFWASDADGDALCDDFGGIVEADPERVRELYRAVFKGREPQVENTSAFYVLTISGAQGRAIIRDWIESTVENVSRNLARHFTDIDLVFNTPPPRKSNLPPRIPLSLLLECLALHGKRDQVIAPWIGRMLGAALKGEPYPLAFMEKAMERYRAEIGRVFDPKNGWTALRLNDARAALIKGVLNRQRRPGKKPWNYKEVRPAMDPHNQEIGYVLGQLMAVLEKLQQDALGNVNAGIVDKYFSSASARPRSVFVHLLRGAEHHLKKLKDKKGNTGWYRRLIGELVSRINSQTAFPATFSLPQQGLFIVGYHQMRHWLWMKKEEKALWAAGFTDLPAAFRPSAFSDNNESNETSDTAGSGQ